MLPTRASRLDTYCSNGGERASPSSARVVPVCWWVDAGVHSAVHGESEVRSVVGLRVLQTQDRTVETSVAQSNMGCIYYLQ